MLLVVRSSQQLELEQVLLAREALPLQSSSKGQKQQANLLSCAVLMCQSDPHSLDRLSWLCPLQCQQNIYFCCSCTCAAAYTEGCKFLH